MKKALISAFLLLLGSTILGATVLREPIARAAAPIASVFVTNDASNPVPVHEQGTPNVHVTNSSLSVEQAPVTGGGGALRLLAGQEWTIPQVATAMSVHLTSDVQTFVFFYQGEVVVVFGGPAFDHKADYDLALTRPVRFDRVRCNALPSGICTLTWVGADS